MNMKLSAVLLGYLVIINLLAFFSCMIDKRRAKKRRHRISEHTLLFLSAIGGALGMLLAMRRFRHKTLHKKFTVPIFLILQLIAIWLFLLLNGGILWKSS